MINLCESFVLVQAKLEREQFIETLKEKDRLLKEKDAQLSKLAHRTMAEEQAFRETLGEARSQFDVRLLQRDNKIRQREMLICDLIEIVTTAEVYATTPSAISHIISRTVQIVPMSKYTVESVCRNQLLELERYAAEPGVSAREFKAKRQSKINEILAIINEKVSEKRRPHSNKVKKKKPKSPKKQQVAQATSLPNFGSSESETDEDITNDVLTYSVSDKELDDISSISIPTTDPGAPDDSEVVVNSTSEGIMEESDYSLAVGEERSSTVLGSKEPSVIKTTTHNSADIALGSRTSSPSAEEATNGISAGPAADRVSSRQSNSISLILGDPPQSYTTINGQGSYFALSSESGSLTEARKKSQHKENYGNDAAGLPYWWSSLSKSTN